MTEPFSAWQCSASVANDETITLAHGEGGRLSRRLLSQRILPLLGPRESENYTDAAWLSPLPGNLAFTTDSFVVSPLFFPGGDIGTLAVFGTVNDLAVSGARPRWISLSLILEEGLPLGILERVLTSIADSARLADVSIVTGDTKVVPRGAADQLFINTAGVGEFLPPIIPGPAALQPGDELLVSGPIGRHGMAVMATREQFDFDPQPTSDCAPLIATVDALRKSGVPLRALRDATRGGVAAVLHEWAAVCQCTMAIDECRLPVPSGVRALGELLGLDPIHVANEGTLVAAVPAGHAQAAIEAMRSVTISAGADLVGHVQPKGLSPVVIQRSLGRYLPLDDPLGAPLPRIC